MKLIALGALFIAIGVGLLNLPAGIIVAGLELVGCGAYFDLTDDDDYAGEPGP